MKTHRWLTLGAAIVITVLETWLFTAASASASPVDTPTAGQPGANAPLASTEAP
jgi:hypothetical protein